VQNADREGLQNCKAVKGTELIAEQNHNEEIALCGS
jgi:hypothetical protein